MTIVALCNCDIYEVLASELLWPHDQKLKTFEVEKQGHHQELLVR